MANWMEGWLDTLCEVMAVTDPQGKQVTSYYVFKRNELPLAVSSEHIPCAISYVNDPEVQYSEGGPLEIFWKGQTEFHLTKDVSPANIPYVLKFYEIILRACAAKMQLGGLVAYFSILQKTANAMQFSVYRNKDNEPDHEGIVVRWEVHQNVSGDMTISR